ncbi:unnamed protein product [Rhizophagus irregularis]|nr:unnamed protein product [Rhizophagus irregularis]
MFYIFKRSSNIYSILRALIACLPDESKILLYFHFKPFLFNYASFGKVLSISEINSELPPDFFYQLSQICHNLQSISVNIHTSSVINELKDLISSQNNLKDLDLSAFHGGSWTDIAPAITKHSHTITKLKLWSDDHISSFSFISSFSNLQELTFSLYIGVTGVFEDFIKLQYVNFQNYKF